MPFALQYFWFWGSKKFTPWEQKQAQGFLSIPNMSRYARFRWWWLSIFSFFFQTYWSFIGMFLYHETCKKVIIQWIICEWIFCGWGCKHWNNWTILGVGTQAKKGWAICVVFMLIISTKGKWEMVHLKNGTQGIPH